MQNVPPDIQLIAVELTNILSFKHATFDNIGQFAVLIGKNNSGKSNLLKALFNFKLFGQHNNEYFFTNTNLVDAGIQFTFIISETVLTAILNAISNKHKIGNLLQAKIPLPAGERINIFEFFSCFYVEIKFTVEGIAVIKSFGIKHGDSEYNLLTLQSALTNSPAYNFFDFFQSGNQVHEDKDGLFFPIQAKGITKGQLNSIKSRADFNQNIPGSEKMLFFQELYDLFLNFLDKRRFIQDYRNFPNETPGFISDTKIASNGSNLPNIIFGYVNNEPEKLVRLNLLMKEFYPEIKEIGQSLSKIKGKDIQKTAPYLIEQNQATRRTFDYIGKGMHQLVVILTHLIELDKNSLLLVEEPELFIHPQLQKILLTIFKKYLEGRQFIISSHSQYFLKNNIDDFSVHHVFKNNGESASKNVPPGEFSDLFSDIGISPADYMMFNGFILVEGKDDANFLKMLLGKYLNEENLEILRLESKNNLRWVNKDLITSLIANGFKFLIILDRDEGNQKIQSELPDEIKNNLMLLPVREYENFLLNPRVLSNYLKMHHEEAFIIGEIDEYVKNLIDKSITEDIKREAIIKAFLDKQPIKLANKERDTLIADYGLEDWPSIFINNNLEKFWVKDFDEEKFQAVFKESEIKVNSYLNEENWKHFPGKLMLCEVRKFLEQDKDIHLQDEDIISLMVDDNFVNKQFIEKIKLHFSSDS
ncbi:MAG TPA: AAA family ATPase [Candidatus Lokiarchaeia archaeon]|nr:AAA family ATPase [Candidatus Lokiarchaeia archaeon]